MTDEQTRPDDAEELPAAGPHDTNPDDLAGDLTDPDIDLEYADAEDQDGGDA